MTSISRIKDKKGAPKSQYRRSYSSSSKYSIQLKKDSYRYYNYNEIGYITIRYWKN
ncbi:hypothetical protein CMUS01_15344 [Colletotrichum musicola]|uniref:Uncharacterized protein n=1 Tax=Colletotrichum musicola TaxID=2175873 RepID=A0A8H6IXZ7_9PEZI|nr:hypothetical protein CMUS01_15344 [Colletotrichum musicola]